MPSAASGPVPRVGHDGLSSGLERALRDFQAANQSDVPPPNASWRPVASSPGRRAFIDTTFQGVAAPASCSPGEDELSKIKEIIEEAVEQQVAAALAPLRVVVNELNKAIQSASQEHTDLHEQNDTLSRQIDLHYRDIQEHSEIASTHIRALTNLISAHTQTNHAANENIATTCNLVGHLSHIANLPQSLGQVVETVISQAVHDTLGQAAAAEQEALDNIRTFLSSQFDSFDFRQPAAAQRQVSTRLQRGAQEAQQESEGSPVRFGKFKALLSKRPKPE